MKQKYKIRFTGITLLNIQFCRFWGWGFELLHIRYQDINLIGYNRSLLSFNVQLNEQNKGRVWKFKYDILFFKFDFKRTVTKPHTQCDFCAKLFSTTHYTHNSKIVCSSECLNRNKEYYD